MQKSNMEERIALTQNLVNHLINEQIIQTERVRDVMLTIDRGEFWTGVDQNGNRLNFDPESYADGPKSINFNVVISAPHLHSHVLVRSYIFPADFWFTNLAIFCRNNFLMYWAQDRRSSTLDAEPESFALLSTRSQKLAKRRHLWSVSSTSRSWPNPRSTIFASHTQSQSRQDASRLYVEMEGRATHLRHLTMPSMSVLELKMYQKTFSSN